MEWTIQLEVKTSRGAAESITLMTIIRPSVGTAAEEVGLSLAEAKTLPATLQAKMARTQLAEHAALGPITSIQSGTSPSTDRARWSDGAATGGAAGRGSPPRAVLRFASGQVGSVKRWARCLRSAPVPPARRGR
jgi:hypothetical protein